MPKNIKLEPHDTPEEWHDKIRKIRNNEHKLKMLVIEKILSNPTISADEVQRTFFISPRTMYNWINQYNEVYKRLKEEIAEHPERKWTLKLKQAYVLELCGVKVTEQAIAYRMKRV